jgi:hypothetical protein
MTNFRVHALFSLSLSQSQSQSLELYVCIGVHFYIRFLIFIVYVCCAKRERTWQSFVRIATFSEQFVEKAMVL